MPNPVILCLGAKSDIVMACAKYFAAKEYDIILAARNSEVLIPLAKDIELRHAVKAEVVEFDQLKVEEHTSFYEKLPMTPTVVLNGIGYLGDSHQAVVDREEALKIIDINYRSEVSILNVAATQLSKLGHGTIIGISSVAGERGRQSNFMYGSAKGGLSIYLDGLRHYLKPKGVHVLTVKPGFVHTKMTEGLSLPPLLTASPDQVAKDIYKAYRKRKNTCYTLWMWRYIMWVIRNIPESIFLKTKL